MSRSKLIGKYFQTFLVALEIADYHIVSHQLEPKPRFGRELGRTKRVQIPKQYPPRTIC